MPKWPKKNSSWKGSILQARSNSTNYPLACQKRQVHALLQGWRRTLTTWIQVSTFSQQDGWSTHFSAIWCGITGYSVPHISRHQSGLTFKSQTTKKDVQERWTHEYIQRWVNWWAANWTEAVCCYEILLSTYQTTPCHNNEDNNKNFHHSENL